MHFTKKRTNRNKWKVHRHSVRPVSVRSVHMFRHKKKKKCNAIENYDVIAGVSFRNIKFNAFSEWRKKLGAKRKRKRRDSYRRLAEATEWKRKHEKNVDRHFQLIQSKWNCQRQFYFRFILSLISSTFIVLFSSFAFVMLVFIVRGKWNGSTSIAWKTILAINFNSTDIWIIVQRLWQNHRNWDIRKAWTFFRLLFLISITTGKFHFDFVSQTMNKRKNKAK